MARLMDDTANFGILAAAVGVLTVCAQAAILSYQFFPPAVARLVAGVLYILFGIAVARRILPQPLSRLFPEGMESGFGCVIAFCFLAGLCSVLIGITASATDGADSGAVYILTGVLTMALGHVASMPRKTPIDRLILPALIVLFLILTLEAVMSFFQTWESGLDGSLMWMLVAAAVAETCMFLIPFLYLMEPKVASKF